VFGDERFTIRQVPKYRHVDPTFSWLPLPYFWLIVAILVNEMRSHGNTRWSRGRSQAPPVTATTPLPLDTRKSNSDTANGPGADSLVCYVLRHHKKNRTYCGMTNNIKRRLRQHNGEIGGGARYTTAHGPGWVVHFVVHGFIDRRDCLRFEWRMKHTNAGHHRFVNPCARREHIMHKLLGAWPSTLTVNFNHSVLCNMPVPTVGNTGPTVCASGFETAHTMPLGPRATKENGITRLHAGLRDVDVPPLVSTDPVCVYAGAQIDNPQATQTLLPAHPVDNSG
jgi:predicted GIY-YIG superfamily endonuclease